MSVSSKWTEKKADQKAGLVFDWRFLVPGGWKLFYFALPFVFLGLVALAWMEVRSDTSLKEAGRRVGNVFYLKEEEHGGLGSFLSRNLPFASRGPVWVDPASLGVDSDAFPLMSGGTKDLAPELALVEPPVPVGELDHLSNRLSLLPADVDGYQGAVEEEVISISPALSRMGGGLEGVRDSVSFPPVEGRPDMGGLETALWVVIDEWGYPERVLVVGESSDKAIDKLAEDYVKGLRWNPSSSVRSGEIIVGWKEAPVSDER